MKENVGPSHISSPHRLNGLQAPIDNNMENVDQNVDQQNEM
jgi:hypothetical protein